MDSGYKEAYIQLKQIFMVISVKDYWLLLMIILLKAGLLCRMVKYLKELLIVGH